MKVNRRQALGMLGAGSGVLLLGCGRTPPPRPESGAPPDYDWDKHYWGYAVDTTKCIGCGACMRACRAENDVPEGRFRTWVERYRIDDKGKVDVDIADNPQYVFEPAAGPAPGKAFFVPKICNHCEKSVCSQVCPVGASYMTRDGVVLVDKQRCVGCGYCVQACPYATRFINPVTHIADKCTLCYHRITRGLRPACVEACPVEARIFANLKDPNSRLNTILKQRRYRLLRPEMGTHPKCYYIGLDLEVI
jgi:Fe-S-cluster-containing dehydrogenase component